MGARWVTHKGKQIMYQDYRGENEAQMLETLKQTVNMMTESPEKVLTISNVHDCSITPAFMEKSKLIGMTVFHKKVARTALVGIVGLKQILLNSYVIIVRSNHPIKAFHTENAALDWLVK